MSRPPRGRRIDVRLLFNFGENMRPLSALLILLCQAPTAGAQATVISAPNDDYLLEVTQQWGSSSPLGELKNLALDHDDREVRLWIGYGLFGTQGTILRRVGGKWTGWRAKVIRCNVVVPLAIADTLSKAAEMAYEVQARTHCGEPTASEGRVFEVDTLQLTGITPPDDIETLWLTAERRGLMTLPPKIPRDWVMLDGTTYVLEVRKGREYRASVIEQRIPPESEPDQRIQAVAAVFENALTPDH